MMTTAQASMLNPSYCFSIRFRGDWTLDLMMLGSSNNPTTPDRDTILDALDNVLDTYQRQKRLVSNDVLLLRYHWMDAVSDKVGTQAASLLYCLNGHTLTCASCSFPFLHPGYVPTDIFVRTPKVASPDELLSTTQGISGRLRQIYKSDCIRSQITEARIDL